MLKKLLILIGFTTSLIFLSGAVQAATTSWIVEGTWAGSGVTSSNVDGSFKFNSDTGEYSEVDIQLIDPGLLICGPGFCSIGVDFTTDDVVLGDSDASFFFAISGLDDPDPTDGLKGKRLLIFTFFDQPLPGATSYPLAAQFGDYGICEDADCDVYVAISDSFGGEIYQDGVSPVPLPAAAWLFGSALLGLGVVKRKKA